MDIWEKMRTGELYLYNDDEIVAIQKECLAQLDEFNQTTTTEGLWRTTLLQRMFAELGEGCYIEPPLHANWGGKFVHFGAHVYANFNLTLVDDGPIYVGDYTQFAPNVILTTATHPICPELRQQGYQYNGTIRIGRNCWLGAGAIVLPGVTIGDNTVIGAGSVVTHDIPANVVAFGTPCRVVRAIDENDRRYYNHNRAIPAAIRDTLPDEIRDPIPDPILASEQPGSEGEQQEGSDYHGL